MGYKELSEYVEKKENKMTTIVCRNKDNKSLDAHVVKTKRNFECVKKIVEFVNGLGYDKITFEFDNETLIKTFRDEIKFVNKKNNHRKQPGAVTSPN